MKTIALEGSLGKSQITLGVPYTTIAEHFATEQVFVITDQNVLPFVQRDFPSVLVHTILPGEHSKSLRNATEIYRWLQHHRADRQALIVGIGGGVVCDLAGFVAATYLRGVRLFLVPTTLLAQVDASVGGKNAVNLDGFKNIVGTVYQPELIVCDMAFLSSLPCHEVQGGLAEVIKHSLISDAEQLEYLASHSEEILSLDPDLMELVVAWSVETKRRFVELDEFDHGERRKLNFGHTWGHAVESVTGVHHGFAVATGMYFAARLGVELGFTAPGTLEAIQRVLLQYGLSLTTQVQPWVIFEAMLKDKKKDNDAINFIFPTSIGSVVVERVPIEEVRKFIEG